MFNKKKVSIIALLLVLVMGLSACAPKSDPAKTNVENGTNTAAPASSLRPEGVPADFPNKEIEYIYAFGAGSVQDAYIRILFGRMETWIYSFLQRRRKWQNRLECYSGCKTRWIYNWILTKCYVNSRDCRGW